MLVELELWIISCEKETTRTFIPGHSKPPLYALSHPGSLLYLHAYNPHFDSFPDPAPWLTLPSTATTTAPKLAVPYNISCSLAPVIADIIAENTRTKPSATVTIQVRLIGTRKSKNTGIRRLPTVKNTPRALARIERRRFEYMSTFSSPVFSRSLSVFRNLWSKCQQATATAEADSKCH